ncbi:Uridine 5'-monophosphate synthase [Orchesella cincta]|uniref:Uridine 5'-monophosphate synthase n=1 Tax=Orchesella cincta TaxID=48709 RepID=A0A1D2MTR2_ORCCI|nr:Uridine 5'-monophosphate synthase [Orchesella cincta]
MGKESELILALFDVGAVKFGSFMLKSGIQSPIYFDLRVIISHPKLMETICEILEDVVGGLKPTDVICGVPYTALPLATILSVRQNIPMIIKRKEQKEYGTGKLIEGEYTEGQTNCLILEDVLTTGSSIVDTALVLRDHGILVGTAIVVLNRNYPAADENLMKHGISLISLIKVDEFLEVLFTSGRITKDRRLELTFCGGPNHSTCSAREATKD